MKSQIQVILLSGVMFGQANIESAHANNYKCRDTNGSISYSDKSCQQGQKQIARIIDHSATTVVIEPPTAMISIEELQGRWIDTPDSAFNSSWYFNGNNVVFANKQGVSMSEKYTLVGDQLTFHHKPGLWGDTGWDETVTIYKHTGQTLVLKWGAARITLYRPG